jgi:hypothetical protein
MLTNKDPMAAVDVYCKFPVSENPTFDDASIIGDIVRLIMKAVLSLYLLTNSTTFTLVIYDLFLLLFLDINFLFPRYYLDLVLFRRLSC